MSGVYLTELLYCRHCNAYKKHYTEWDSEEPKLILAQCEHLGPRMTTYLTPSDVRTIGTMTYQFA